MSALPALNYQHYCEGCNYGWIDIHLFYVCPWCGGAVSNEAIDEEIPFVTE